MIGSFLSNGSAFFNDTATTEIYTLSLHDALPILRGMTTLHTDDVRNIPDRILNMLESRVDAERMENDIYQALDVGILIRKRRNEDGVVYRYIDQVCFFYRENYTNHVFMLVSDGQIVTHDIPKVILRRFKREGVNEPFGESFVNEIRMNEAMMSEEREALG